MTTLYRKYRPTIFQEITGQKYVIKTLTNSIKNGLISHAYLFTGPRGTGKTTTARIFAKAVNCLKPLTNIKNNFVKLEPCNKCPNCQTIIKNQGIDLIEIDAASHTGVDNIRQLKESINTPPTNFKYKVYIIDEVHMLSAGAFNALLKTLEEPPEHAIFILATTELSKVPETIISRCQRYNIKPLTKNQITERLQQIAEKEKIIIEKEALETIATEAGGGMRDAETLFGQIISIGEKKITNKKIRDILGISSNTILIKVIKEIGKKNALKTIQLINQVQENGFNLNVFANQLLEYFRNVMLFKLDHSANNTLLKDLTKEQLSELKEISASFTINDVIFIISLLQESKKRSSQSDIPQLSLEMSLIKYFLTTKKISTTITRENKEKNSKIEPTTKKKEFSDNPVTTKTPPTANNRKKTVSSKKENLNISLNSILDQWGMITDLVEKENKSIAAFLQNSVPIKIDGDTIIIKTKYKFHQDTLNEAKNRLTIEQAFAKILKVAIRTTFSMEDKSDTSTKEHTQKNGDALLYEAMKKVGGEII